MLEEPLSHPTSSSYLGLNRPPIRSLLFNNFDIGRPAIDVMEEAKHYVLEAELPGVRKENIEVRIGDAGRSVTIEGNFIEQRKQPQVVEAPNSNIEPTKAGELGFH